MNCLITHTPNVISIASSTSLQKGASLGFKNPSYRKPNTMNNTNQASTSCNQLNGCKRREQYQMCNATIAAEIFNQLKNPQRPRSPLIRSPRTPLGLTKKPRRSKLSKAIRKYLSIISTTVNNQIFKHLSTDHQHEVSSDTGSYFLAIALALANSCLPFAKAT